MREVAIIGVGISGWEETQHKSIKELFMDAAIKAINDSKIDSVDSILVSNKKLVSSFGEIRNSFALKFGINPNKIQAKYFSPLIAFKKGFMEVAVGFSNIVLIGGVEKHSNLEKITNYTKRLASYFATIAKTYMKRYSVPRRHLSMVAVKNHENGCRNIKARFQIKITPEAVEDSLIVADPLRELDCSIVSDGAAALILCPLNIAKRLSKYDPIKVSGLGYCNYRSQLDSLSLSSAQEASKKAYKMAGLSPNDISLAEVHDNFTISELVILESLSLFETGSAGKATENGVTRIEGRLPVNPSGGLKSKGYAISVNGIAQLAELTNQLRQIAGPNQVKVTKRALAHNMSPYGEESSVTILEAI